MLDNKRHRIRSAAGIAYDIVNFCEVVALKVIEPAVEQLLPEQLATVVGSTDIECNGIVATLVEVPKNCGQRSGREPVKGRGMAGWVIINQQRQFKRVGRVRRIVAKQIRRGREPHFVCNFGLCFE